MSNRREKRDREASVKENREASLKQNHFPLQQKETQAIASLLLSYLFQLRKGYFFSLASFGDFLTFTISLGLPCSLLISTVTKSTNSAPID